MGKLGISNKVNNKTFMSWLIKNTPCHSNKA